MTLNDEKCISWACRSLMSLIIIVLCNYHKFGSGKQIFISAYIHVIQVVYHQYTDTAKWTNSILQYFTKCHTRADSYAVDLLKIRGIIVNCDCTEKCCKNCTTYCHMPLSHLIADNNINNMISGKLLKCNYGPMSDVNSKIRCNTNVYLADVCMFMFILQYPVYR